MNTLKKVGALLLAGATGALSVVLFGWFVSTMYWAFMIGWDLGKWSLSWFIG